MRTSELPLLIKMLFTRHGYWKLFSLVIALILYFSIRAEISHVRVLTLPVDIDMDIGMSGAVVESVEPRSVQVTVRGSYSEVAQLSTSHVRCLIRPKQRKNEVLDKMEVKIKPSNMLGIRRGLRVVKVEPNPVVVRFDVPMSLNLPVAPPALLGKARGRVDLACDLTNAVVKGSRRSLTPLDPESVQIQCEMIDVDGRSQPFTTIVKLIPPGDALNAVVDPPEMSVNVVIVSEKKTVKLERVPVMVVQPYPSLGRWRIDPETVDIEVTGRSEIVDAILFGEILASVNGSQISTSMTTTNEVQVVVHARQGLVVDEMRPLPGKVKIMPVPVTLESDTKPLP